MATIWNILLSDGTAHSNHDVHTYKQQTTPDPPSASAGQLQTSDKRASSKLGSVFVSRIVNSRTQGDSSSRPEMPSRSDFSSRADRCGNFSRPEQTFPTDENFKGTENTGFRVDALSETTTPKNTNTNENESSSTDIWSDTPSLLQGSNRSQLKFGDSHDLTDGAAAVQSLVRKVICSAAVRYARATAFSWATHAFALQIIDSDLTLRHAIAHLVFTDDRRIIFLDPVT